MARWNLVNLPYRYLTQTRAVCKVSRIFHGITNELCRTDRSAALPSL